MTEYLKQRRGKQEVQPCFWLCKEDRKENMKLEKECDVF